MGLCLARYSTSAQPCIDYASTARARPSLNRNIPKGAGDWPQDWRRRNARHIVISIARGVTGQTWNISPWRKEKEKELGFSPGPSETGWRDATCSKPTMPTAGSRNLRARQSHLLPRVWWGSLREPWGRKWEKGREERMDRGADNFRSTQKAWNLLCGYSKEL